MISTWVTTCISATLPTAASSCSSTSRPSRAQPAGRLAAASDPAEHYQAIPPGWCGVDPQAEKAADWQFTYNRNGVKVEVLNRNVLANAQHAYALYWSTPVSDWNAYYHYFQVFAATFQPAP